MRDGGAAAAERPDGVLPEAGAARGQRVRGGAAQGEETVQYSLLDTIIGITGQANIKPASKYLCVRILFGVSIIFSSKVFLLYLPTILPSFQKKYGLSLILQFIILIITPYNYFPTKIEDLLSAAFLLRLLSPTLHFVAALV